MRKLWSAALYLALTAGANTAAGEPVDLAPYLVDDMRKLAVHSEPRAVSDVEFTAEYGGALRLSGYEGRVVVLNFWATWCAPCREEMPTLDALQAALGSDDFIVLTIASGRNPAPAMANFFAQAGVTNLPLHTDLRQALSRDMGVLGLPVTVVINREGLEIGRLQGEADWAAPAAIALLTALIEEDA